MLQEATTAVWDLNQTTAGPNGSQKLFMLLLLVACIAASKKLVRVWRAQPLFRQLRESHRSQYASLLQSLPATSSNGSCSSGWRWGFWPPLA